MPNLFPDHIIDEIRDKCNIAEVIAQYIPLKRSGRNFKALCPFHHEKTPSFMVNPDKGIFHCFGCFPSGSLIKTETGFHKIEDARVGQLVLTHRGRLMPVIRTLWRPYNGKVVEIYTRKSNLPVTLTADHEVFVIKTKNCHYKSRRNKICQWRCKLNCPVKFFKEYKIDKLSAGQLSINDYLLYPVNRKENDVKFVDLNNYYNRKESNFGPDIYLIPTKVKVDDKFLKLIGYWIAEGSNHRAYIRFSLGAHEKKFAKEIEELIKTIFHLKTSIHIRKKCGKTGLEMTACNSKLSNMFENLCGKHAENKHIPFEFQNLPLKKQEIILNAIFKGDGYTGKVAKCKENRKFKSVKTTSLVLAEQLKDILLRLGISPNLWFEDAKVDKKNTKHKTAYSISWQENIKLHFSDIIQIDNVFYQILPIRKIVKKGFIGDVYNLTVAKDHSYTTPNFVVGNCGKGGNVFNFIMKYEGLDFPQVVRLLAEKTNVQLPSSSMFVREQKDVHDLFQLNELACAWFQSNLKKDASRAALEYLKKREFSAKAILTFRLGFAAADNGLLNFMRTKGVKEELLEKAGLVICKEQSCYDRFKQRIIFPIFDSTSRIIGFGARVLDDSLPKYMNSPDTPIYNKGNHLYGLNFAKEEIKRLDFCIIVEGYVDLITVFQHDVTNVVASLGTALTPQQIRQLRRYTQNMVVVFDADRAGELASLRSLDLLIEEDVNVKIVSLPKAEDPDSFLRKFGQDKFREKVAQASDLFDYKLNLLIQNYDLNTVEGKVGIAKQMLSTIHRVQNAIQRGAYVKRLAEEFSRGEKSLGEEWILAELKKVKKDFSYFNKEDLTEQIRLKTLRPAEEMLLKIILTDEETIGEIKKNLTLEDFQDLRIRETMRIVYRIHSQGQGLKADRLISYLETQDSAQLISRISSCAEEIVNQHKTLADCIKRIKMDNLKDQLNRLQREIKLAQSWGHKDKITELVTKYNHLMKSRGVKDAKKAEAK